MPSLYASSIDDVLTSLEDWREMPEHLSGDIFIGTVGFERRIFCLF